jgi:hypothetical protein
LLQPLSEHVLVLDLDGATLSGAVAAELRALARETPCLQRLEQRLVGCCETEGSFELDERHVQAALLSFMREILSVAPQQALRPALPLLATLPLPLTPPLALAPALTPTPTPALTPNPNSQPYP